MENIHIYHTNDVHSHIENWPRIKQFLADKHEDHQQKDEDVFLFDIGDFIDRWHPFTEATNGKGNIDLLNESQYTAVTIGNNEGVNLPYDDLNMLYEHAHFDVLLANLYQPNGGYPTWVRPYKVYQTKKGTRVGVIGLTAHFIFREHWAKVIPPTDNKFAALNSAVWSGGSFIYVPPGVKVDTPLQAYFRINSENMGQFERTLIIVDEGAHVHYVEGCTAPVYTTNSLHSAVVEIVIKKDAYCRYTTIQNWANNVFNLVTKRAVCEANATMEWIDGNIGSKLTMKYPAVILKGEGARGLTLSIAIAGKGQHQDAGAKMIHLAPNTSSTIVSKSISKHGGKVTYRGQVHFGRKADGARSNIECDTLIMDNKSTSDTIPYNEILNDNISLEHEAKVSKVSEEQLFYLMSRGISEQEATEMIVMGFIEPFTKELPMEYAVEMNRLIKFEMEGSIG